MSSASDIASRFSISGLLDESSKTRERYPVAEIDVNVIEGHPDNVAYSMDERSVRSLARSIERDGLTDIPLVRKLGDGSWQMISGHRRLEAYRLLADSDDRFAKIPCRVIEGITDSQAITLLHTANYFVRALTVTERARATEALGLEVERLREEDPGLSGMRTAEIKAAMLEQQTGKAVSGRSILRDEKLARVIKDDLSRHWAQEADEGRLSAASIGMLKELPREKQARLFVERPAGLSKKETTDYLRERLCVESETDKRLVRVIDDLKSYASSMPGEPCSKDRDALTEIKRLSARIAKMAR
ncbi:ParB N-terminal domain-containing protein [Adlercreutzia sp. ZJ473]|uniref:ParB/RepB/Spo0J family partition protein n=1 Tax=Adlercreutzia sp. ZJ473 TaxID=2722822 RepID=UPI001C12E3EF|nr:ParB N-terminal domain-containing protein [Adlercreutzia sp. ZJ473]